MSDCRHGPLIYSAALTTCCWFFLFSWAAVKTHSTAIPNNLNNWAVEMSEQMVSQMADLNFSTTWWPSHSSVNCHLIVTEEFACLNNPGIYAVGCYCLRLGLPDVLLPDVGYQGPTLEPSLEEGLTGERQLTKSLPIGFGQVQPSVGSPSTCRTGHTSQVQSIMSGSHRRGALAVWS